MIIRGRTEQQIFGAFDNVRARRAVGSVVRAAKEHAHVSFGELKALGKDS